MIERRAFEALVGQTFTLTAGMTSHQLTLLEVTTRDAAVPRPFSVVFLGPARPVLPQRTYTFAHDGLGTHEIFIVPIGPDPTRGGMRYEAVFN